MSMKYRRLKDIHDAPDGESVYDLINDAYRLGRKEGLSDLISEVSWMGESDSQFLAIYHLLWSIYDREEFE